MIITERRERDRMILSVVNMTERIVIDIGIGTTKVLTKTLLT